MTRSMKKKDIAVLSLIRLVVSGARPTKPGNAEEIGFDNGTWELVKGCWKPKPSKRPTIESVLAHLPGYLASNDTEAMNHRRVAKLAGDEKGRGVVARVRFSALRLGRQSHVNPPLAVIIPEDAPPFRSHEIDAQPDHPDHGTVLSQWQYLGSLDSKSPQFVELLERLVDAEDNRSLALDFTGDDAGMIIDIIGGVSSCIPP